MNFQRFTRAALALGLAAGMATTAIAQADNSNSKIAPASSFSGWMSDYSKTNQGRIARDAYMQESGRRWDAMDHNKQGLTTDQVNAMYGYQPYATPAPKDSMGNTMAPGSVRK